MTGYHADTAFGRVVAGEKDTIFHPRTPRSGYGVVLCHGLGNPDNYMDPVNQPAASALAANIARRGIPCITGAFGGDGFGNDVQVGHMDAARDALAAAMPRMATDKVLLLGCSHGGAMSVRYAIERPGEVAGLVGIIPALDLAWLWDNVASLRAALGAAYGVAHPTPLPADGDTLARAAELVDVPQLYGYSTIDASTPPENVERFVDQSAGEALVIDTVSGHTNATIGKMPLDRVLKFLLANGA